MDSQETVVAHPPPAAQGKDTRFKYILICLCLTLSLSALEFASVSTALPTIVLDLKGTQFIWVTSAYTLTSAAVIPLIGGLAEIFGRKPTTLLVILCFAVGSAICGAAQNMTMLIVGRAIQGLGGGAVVVITNIVLADMVPLHERGGYGGLLSFTWCLTGVLSLLLGGGLSQAGQWRWLFYINLPICAISLTLAAIFMDLPKPPGSWRSKVTQIDWVGNLLIITSSTSTTFALTDGGINFPWTSFQILIPLILGLFGFVLFFAYEAVLASNPLVPFDIINNKNYIPVYFQGVQLQGPLLSGASGISLVSLALFAILGGISVKILKVYRPQIWVGWCLQIIGAGLLITIRYDNAKTLGYCLLFGTGAGINYAAQYYPIQSSLPIETSAQALAFHGFSRSFAAIWGVTIGGAVLQNSLAHNLPEEVISQVGAGVGLLYAIIPQIRGFDEPLRGVLQQAFLDSLRPVWIVITGLSVAGLLSSLIMENVPMHIHTDKKWDPLHGKETDVEKGIQGVTVHVEPVLS